MAGHSKWSKIKRQKAVNDTKRGKLFTRFLREIQIAAKHGGGSLDGNPRLRHAVQTAKSQGVPNDNIDKAIKRGTGDLEGVEYEEVLYEGYGPAGVALLIKTLTDNRTRTVAEVRYILGKYNGSLASANAVSYMFKDRGVFTLSKEAISEEKLYETVLEAGADDIRDEEDVWEITCTPSSFDTVSEVLDSLNLEFEGEIRSIPDTTISVAGDDAEGLLKLIDALDDLDDVQDVTANFDVDESELERINQ